MSKKQSSANPSGSLVAAFEAQVLASPDALAVIDGDKKWTYSELNARANGIAHEIQSLGLERNSPIAILLDLEADAISAVYGILKSGNFYVPLDPEWPLQRMEVIFGEIKPSCLISSERYEQKTRLLEDQTDKVFQISKDFEPTPINVLDTTTPEDLAYVMYTSGSTGVPKGVMQNRKSLLFDSLRQGQDLSTSRNDRYGLLFPLSSSASCCSIFGAILNGATACCLDLHRYPISELGDWFNRDQISICDIHVAALRLFSSSLDGSESFPSMRMIAPGGEPLYHSDVELCRKIFSEDCLVQNSLGTTETRTATQFFISKQTSLSGAQVPVGTAVLGKHVVLLDDHMNEVKEGEIGIRSHFLSPGYWGRPELTQKVFVSDDDKNGPLYLTGDIGRLNERGQIVHLGRKDHQIKVRGYRVELEEIENLLLQASGVVDAAVTAIPDHKGELRLHAFLACPDDVTLTLGNIRKICEESLPRPSHPSHYYRVDELPKTQNGKLARNRLKGLSGQELLECTIQVGPSSQLENKLCDIFQSVLRLSDVGIHCNFLELGGDSLRVLECLLRIEKETGRRVTPQQFYNRPTVSELSEFLSEVSLNASQINVVCLTPDRSGRPIYLLPGLYGATSILQEFASKLSPNFSVFGLESLGYDQYQRFEDYAAEFAKEIMDHQQEGEIIIGGHSYGGVLAFETARQLQAKGRKIQFVGLIDSFSPIKQSLSQNLFRFFGNISDWLLEEWKNHSLQYQFKKLIFKLKRKTTALIRHLQAANNSLEHYDVEKIPDSLSAKLASRLALLDHYSPVSESLKIILFQAKTRPLLHSFTPAKQWSQIAGDELKTTIIPGNHETIFKEHLNVLVSAMNSELTESLQS